VRKFISIILVAASFYALSACAQVGSDKGSDHKKEGDMKTLIVYFSFTAGNTKRIAEKIHAVVGGDLVRLETVTPYTESYDEVVSQGQDEVNRGFKPKLKALGVNVVDYDRIIVGSPTWWYKMAPAVLSFLSGNDFKGKIVVPFMTNAGWRGTVIKDMTAEAERNGAVVENAHEFRFSSDSKHFDRIMTPENELKSWINGLK
jgi:flavodoxin